MLKVKRNVTPRGRVTPAEYQAFQLRRMTGDRSAIEWVSLGLVSGALCGALSMITGIIFFRSDTDASMLLIPFLVGALFPVLSAVVFDGIQLWKMNRRQRLIGFHAPSWVLMHNSLIGKINWFYLKKKLAPNELNRFRTLVEASSILGFEATGTVGEALRQSQRGV